MSTETETKPDYVLALEAAYGPPSQEGFGAAVFFEHASGEGDLEETAKKYYQYFVGDLWERWGEEAWMSPWKQVYAREAGAVGDIVSELRAIDDRDAAVSVPLIVDVSGDAEAARKALADAFDAPEVTDLRVYNIGDGEAMSGLLVAGQRENGEVTILTALLD